MNSSLLAERTSSGRRRWLRVNEMPFSRRYVYGLIAEGKVTSVLLKIGNSKKGCRLIDGDSLDQFLLELAEQQKEVVK